MAARTVGGESWRECELHARHLLGEIGFKRLQEEIAVGEVVYGVRERVVRKVAEKPSEPYDSGPASDGQSDLF